VLLALAGGPAVGGTEKETSVHTNRLALETSPYLLQHAHNPVDWYPWGEEAFHRARAEDKPVFLSVGYSTCHWCHVMEVESFEDEEVAAFLNEHFIAIKVDREELPDVDDLYMTVVQLLTGRGGWPMSVWLTPDRKPFFGGTYFPKAQFLQVLDRVATVWREDRSGLRAQAERVAAALTAQMGAVAAARALEEAPLEQVVKDLAERFDEGDGGFGGAPKFPNETNLLLLLGRYERTGDPEALRMATVTLRRMAAGGIYDHVGGGFHRYSVDAVWLVPHFEKMLYNQAWLGRAYLEAHRLTGEPRFRRVVEETLAYVARDMTAPEGAFYTAEDADSEGEEGRFYVWTRPQIAAVLTGDGEADVFCRAYGVTDPGNFEQGTSILHAAESPEALAAALGTTPGALEERLAGMRARLLEARARRERPLRDDKILTGWNGMMIGTFARAGEVLERPDYVAAAARAADFVLERLRGKDGSLLRVFRGGEARIPAYQEDHAYLIDGLLELYRATGDPARLGQARDLADRMVASFWDESAGGFYASGEAHDRLLVRGKEAYDGAVPSGNAVAADALVRLARYTGESTYERRAEATLAAFAGAVERTPLAFTYLLHAADGLWNGESGATVTDLRGILTAAVAPGVGRTAPGNDVAFDLRLAIRPGWHVNAVRPGPENLIPTRLEVEGFGIPLRLVDVALPAGEALELPFAEGPVRVYEGELRVPVRLAIGPGEAAPRVARLRLHYQACDDRKCLAPAVLPLSIPLLLEPGTAPLR
jgi:hypothetical protein